MAAGQLQPWRQPGNFADFHPTQCRRNQCRSQCHPIRCPSHCRTPCPTQSQIHCRIHCRNQCPSQSHPTQWSQSHPNRRGRKPTRCWTCCCRRIRSQRRSRRKSPGRRPAQGKRAAGPKISMQKKESHLLRMRAISGKAARRIAWRFGAKYRPALYDSAAVSQPESTAFRRLVGQPHTPNLIAGGLNGGRGVTHSNPASLGDGITDLARNMQS